MSTTAERPHDQTKDYNIHDLLEQLEVDARTTAQRLEAQGRLTGGFTYHYYPLTKREQAIGRVYRAAFTLADNITVCRALLRGENVPRHLLNQAMVAAHERRQHGR